jgi:hypothetical protein
MPPIGEGRGAAWASLNIPFLCLWSTIREKYWDCGHNTEKHTLTGISDFYVLLPAMWKNYWRCLQQPGTFFRIVGNNAEKYSALWATMWNNYYNAE